MWHYPALLILSPLLFLQGKYVRKTVPVLPEPKGARSGVSGSGQKIRLLIIGDSAAAGVGVDDQDKALSGWLVSELSKDFELSWKVAAKTGYQSGDTLSMLKRMPVKTFDIVVTSLGVNDVTGGRKTKQFLNDQGEIVGLLKTKFGAKKIVLSGLPPMYKFPALPQPLCWALGWRAQTLDHGLEQWAVRQTDCIYVKSNYTLDAACVAVDGFHPGAKLYRLWGQAVAEQIRETLLPREST